MINNDNDNSKALITLQMCKVTITTSWANSADNKLMLFFLFFSQKTGKNKEIYFNVLSAEIFTQSSKC